MPQTQSQPIPRDKFLTMAANLLHQVLLDVPRTQAKTSYKAMSSGQAVNLATVKMEDQSVVRFQASLDFSEFNGKINFGSFRNSLALLVSNLGQALNADKEITVFTQENESKVMIFGVTAVTQAENTANIMVLGADTSEGQPAVMLRLMYIDNTQFGQPDSGAPA